MHEPFEAEIDEAEWNSANENAQHYSDDHRHHETFDDTRNYAVIINHTSTQTNIQQGIGAVQTPPPCTHTHTHTPV